MTKNELLARYNQLAEEKKVKLNGIYSSSNKAQIESAISCLECTDETLNEYLTVIKSKYPNIYKTISNNGDFKLHPHNRYYVFIKARNILDVTEKEKAKMANINWDDPAARAELIERIGIEAYNKALEEHLNKSAVATVGGHVIRPIGTRFGKLYQVGDTGKAFKTLEQAKEYARKTQSKMNDAE